MLEQKGVGGSNICNTAKPPPVLDHLLEETFCYVSRKKSLFVSTLQVEYTLFVL